MLAGLIPLFFLAAPLGSPVPGLLVFVLIGLWHAVHSWRAPQHAGAFRWTREDSVLALCFMSIALFKLFTLLWSANPRLALGNVAWHLYFLFWPLVLIGLARCTPRWLRQEHLDLALALGLVLTAGVGLYAVKVQGHPNLGGLGNVGITAQLLMVLGSWNLLALTRPSPTAGAARLLLALAFMCTWIALVLTTRRLELLGFSALSLGIVLYRLWHRLSGLRLTLLVLLLMAGMAWAMSWRWDKFAQGWTEVHSYFERRAQGMPYVDSSWGARLEMWRLAWQGITEHPWLGLSASARPYDLPGAPPLDVFGHRHFHSHLLQTLIEGGVLGLGVFLLALWTSTRLMIVRLWRQHREIALLGLALLAAYAAEGAASAALVYDKPNALLVVASAWVWLQARQARQTHRQDC